ncbi:hypothetical protein D3C72_2090420 [compost metagenome]
MVGGRREVADERTQVSLAGRRQGQAQVIDGATASVGSDLAALHLVGVLVTEAGAGNTGKRLEVLEVGTEHFAVEHLG